MSEDDLLDHPLIAQRYFFPRPGPLAEPFWIGCGDARLACHLNTVERAAGTVVHFHGNGEIVSDYLPEFVETLGRLGWSCLLVEYRGYGRSSGRPAMGRMLDDVERVVQFLGRKPGDLVFFGRSVGSIYAIHAASCFPGAAGLILESGIADVLERLLLRVTPEELAVDRAALEQAVAARLDHRAKLAAFPGPVLVMHTRHDGLVDVSHGERLHDWAAGPKTLRIFEHGDHNSIMWTNARAYFAEVDRFLAGV
jgi:pimeloyl-ACP methyl ester carboxylesterase